MKAVAADFVEECAIVGDDYDDAFLKEEDMVVGGSLILGGNGEA